jgi:hypothetical protein
MKIENLKDLSQIIDLCRKKGIKTIVLDGLHIEFGEPPTKRTRAKDDATQPQADTEFTDEQLMFWSAGGAAE